MGNSIGGAAAAGQEILDVRYDGRAGLVGAWLCGEDLIDCGPGACLDQLLSALGERTPRRLLLTHIHLDHAGAAGALVERWPSLLVFVHPRGARHLIDPSRLLDSARRVFGERFDRVVGPLGAVPEANVRMIADGERIGPFRAVWTPGHASHHIAFLQEETGTAFPGDVAGVRLGAGPILPPTPPPDIDLRSWRASLETVKAWDAARLALPHFGLVEDPPEHLARMREVLDLHERWARDGEEQFVLRVAERLGERLSAQEVEDYAVVSPFESCALGLRRWLEQDET